MLPRFGLLRRRPAAWLGLGLAIVVLALGGWRFVRSANASVARLELPGYPTHLESGKPGEIVSGAFTLRNVGTAILTYSITPSCGCSDLTPRQGAIRPHDAQEFRIGVRLTGYGAEKVVSLAIDSNAVNLPKATYEVRASCPPPAMRSALLNASLP